MLGWYVAIKHWGFMRIVCTCNRKHSVRSPSFPIDRGPKTHPKYRNQKKHRVSTNFFEKFARTFARSTVTQVRSLSDPTLRPPISRYSCELFFPLQSPGSPWGGNPRKMGKNYKIPLPGPTPENGEKLPKNYRKNAPKIHFL